MTSPRRLDRRSLAVVLALCLFAAACGSDDAGGGAATTLDTSATETTLVSAAPESSGDTATTNTTVDGSDTDEGDPDEENTDGTTETTVDATPDATIEPGDGGDEPWMASPVADAVLTPAEVADELGGSWVLDSARITTAEDASGSSTCGVTDPPTFDGIEAQFFVEESELELGQIIQLGDGVDVWVRAFERLAECDGEFLVSLTDVTVAGADDWAILESDGAGDDGYITGGGAQRGDVFVGFVAFADVPDDLPTPAALAAMLESSLGEAVISAATTPIGTTPVAALSEGDLETVGLGGGFELIRLDEALADPVADEWNGEPCTLPDSDAFDGFDLELVGPFGDPRIVQIVATGPDVSQWADALAGLSGCGDDGGFPFVRADLWVEGADDAVVLGSDGVDAEGTSYAGAVGVAGDTAVIVFVFADSPDDPALDVRTVAELAAVALARR